MLTTEIKDKIIDATLLYMQQNNLKMADMSRISNITETYMSFMLKKKHVITNGTNPQGTVIHDKYYNQLADFIDMERGSSSWVAIPHNNFKAVIATLQETKQASNTAMIIGRTGLGKSFAVEKFALKNPAYTYRIIVNEMMLLNDVIKELCRMLGLADDGTKAARMKRVFDKLKEIKRSGHQPQIIFDEMENAKAQLIRMIKTVFDNVNTYCSIVLIGTDQLLRTLEKLERKDVVGIPQFIRRFKAGTRRLDEVLDFEPFYNALKILDKGLKKLLNVQCANYGELHDYLQPVIEECNAKGEPVTEEAFRIKWNMPK